VVKKSVFVRSHDRAREMASGRYFLNLVLTFVE
jgi:hypothetical protein